MDGAFIQALVLSEDRRSGFVYLVARLTSNGFLAVQGQVGRYAPGVLRYSMREDILPSLGPEIYLG